MQVTQRSLIKPSIGRERRLRFSNLPFLFGVFICVVSNVHASQQRTSESEPLSEAAIKELVQKVTDTQVQFLIRGEVGFRYMSHWNDHERGETAEVIESADGSISRILDQNGQPLSSEVDEKERNRLLRLLHPGKLQEANQSARRLQPYFLELIRAMPQAMVYTQVRGQPQEVGLNNRRVVLAYRPSPAFHPKTLVESALSKLSGRLWIDAEEKHLLHMEIHVDRDVNVAGGLVAKVFAGGTVDYNQRLISKGQYAWTHIRLHLRVRELLVKSVPIDADLTASDIQLLSPIPSGSEAIRLLSAIQVKTR